MEKWGFGVFDTIFSGTNEEQELKANRFRTGLSAKVRKACALYADAVLYPEDRDQAQRRFQEVRDLEAAHAAMIEDPRGVALRAWIEKREADKSAEELKSAIVDLLTINRGPRQ